MVKIIADTTCGLPHDLLRDKDIPLIPQIVIFGDDSYKDDSELDTATFLQKLKAAKELPKTAAPPPPLYYPYFENARQNGETLIIIAPSAKVSGTVRSIEVASQDFPDVDIRLVDTQTIAGNLGTLVLLADQWAKEGKDANMIVTELNQLIPRQRTYFLVDTLEYLQKGGRIGGAQALLGEMLQIKPILAIRDGQVEPFEQQRTKRRALARLIEIVKEQSLRGSESYLSVMQADAQNEADLFANTLKSVMAFPDIPIYELPPAIVVHGGPKTMAVGFFTAPMV